MLDQDKTHTNIDVILERKFCKDK